MKLAGGKGRGGCAALLVILAALTPARAHHMQSRPDGALIGIAIPAITHGEMPIIDKYRAAILDLAARQPRTNPTLRRLKAS